MNEYKTYNCSIIIGSKESFAIIKAHYIKIEEKVVSFYRIDEINGNHNLHALYPINNIMIRSIEYPDNRFDEISQIFKTSNA